MNQKKYSKKSVFFKLLSSLKKHTLLRISLFVTILFCLIINQSVAQTKIPFEALKDGKINGIPFCKIYETNQNLKVRLIDSLISEKKIALAKQKASQGFSQNFFWIQFELDWSSIKQDLLLEINNPHIDEIALYQKNGNQFTKIGFGGDRNLKFSNRSYQNRRYIFPLKNTEVPTVYYLMIDKRNASVSFPLWIWNKQNFEITESKQNIYFGLFFGVIFFLGILSLVTGFFIKRKVFLFYGGYALSMGLYLFTALGFSFQYLYPYSTSFNNYSRILLSVILAIFTTLFLRLFLNIDQNSPKISKFYKIITAVLIGLTLAWVFFSDLYQVYTVWLLNISYALFLSIFICAFWAGYLALKNNKFNAIVFFMAFSVVIIGIIAYLGIEYGFVNEDIFPLNPIFIGSGFEIVILSFAMIYQLSKIIKAKQNLEIKTQELQKDTQSLEAKNQELIEASLTIENKGTVQKNESIILKSKVVLNTAEILYIKSDGHYAEISLEGREKPEIERASLSSLLELLPEQDFLRIHKSFVVNIRKIKIINSTEVMLENGEWIKLSRTYKEALKKSLS